MPNDMVPLDYQCPVCGEQAIAGSHFCRRPDAKTSVKSAPAKAPPNHVGLVRLVGLAVAALLLWSWAGPWSLLWVGLGTVLLLLWKNRRR